MALLVGDDSGASVRVTSATAGAEVVFTGATVTGNAVGGTTVTGISVGPTVGGDGKLGSPIDTNGASEEEGWSDTVGPAEEEG